MVYLDQGIIKFLGNPRTGQLKRKPPKIGGFHMAQSFYKISGIPVFLTSEKRTKLNAISDAYKGMGITDILFRKPEDEKKADRERIKTLTNLARESPEKFNDEWVLLNLKGEDARLNACQLLGAYCDYWGATYLEVDGMTAAGFRQFSWPALDTLILHIYNKSTLTKFLSMLGSSRGGTTTSFVLNIGKLTSLEGTLEHFDLKFESFTLKCGKDCQMVPN
jgi:hypothetical protein